METVGGDDSETRSATKKKTRSMTGIGASLALDFNDLYRCQHLVFTPYLASITLAGTFPVFLNALRALSTSCSAKLEAWC